MGGGSGMRVGGGSSRGCEKGGQASGLVLTYVIYIYICTHIVYLEEAER